MSRLPVGTLRTIPTTLAIAVGLVLAACAGAPGQAGSTPLGGQSSEAAASMGGSATSSGGSATSLVEAARAVTDACTLMPMDLAASIVPNAAEPQSQQFPTSCTVTNGTSVLQITIAAYDAVDPLAANESVAGLDLDLQKPAPDDAYLKVILDPNGGAIYVEVAGHDGKDHGDDAIAVAERVLAGLQ